MKEAAIEVCGKGKRGFSKKRDEWWDNEVQDAVERKKYERVKKRRVYAAKPPNESTDKGEA